MHARAVTEEIVAKQVSSIRDFMGSNYDTTGRELDDCTAKQTNTRFVYGYEYLETPRLVITPLTDKAVRHHCIIFPAFKKIKCFSSLAIDTLRVHTQLGGAPAGPAGTGR